MIALAIASVVIAIAVCGLIVLLRAVWRSLLDEDPR